MPIYKPKFDTSLARACWELAETWQTSKNSTPPIFQIIEFERFFPSQKEEFFGTLLNGTPLGHSKINAMNYLYEMDSYSNVEIVVQWIRLCIKERWEPIVDKALKLVTDQGRLKYIMPLYRDLYGWEEKRQQAIDTFLANREKMMYVSSSFVSRILLKDSPSTKKKK